MELPVPNPYDAKLWLCDELPSGAVQVTREIDRVPVPSAPHSHDFYEFIFFRSCGGVQYLVGQTLYSPTPGDVLLIPPGTSHCTVFPEHMSAPLVRDVLQFTQTLLYIQTHRDSGLFLQPRQNAFLYSPSGYRLDLIDFLFEAAFRECKAHFQYWEQAVQLSASYLVCVLLRMWSDQAPPALPGEKSPFLLQVINYIDKNLGEKITLESTAEYFSVSRSTLSQTFRKKTGVSFYTYVIQRRLLAAKSLIRQGMPLEQAGKSVGFAEYSAFYRAFRQKFGISPKEFRDCCSSFK